MGHQITTIIGGIDKMGHSKLCAHLCLRVIQNYAYNLISTRKAKGLDNI